MGGASSHSNPYRLFDGFRPLVWSRQSNTESRPRATERLVVIKKYMGKQGRRNTIGQK